MSKDTTMGRKRVKRIEPRRGATQYCPRERQTKLVHTVSLHFGKERYLQGLVSEVSFFNIYYLIITLHSTLRARIFHDKITFAKKIKFRTGQFLLRILKLREFRRKG